MSNLDNHKIYSTADGGTVLVNAEEPFSEWRATMWRTSAVSKNRRVLNDICSTTKKDCLLKIINAKRCGWRVEVDIHEVTFLNKWHYIKK